MTATDMDHMKFLEAVLASDLAVLREKEATYQGSWKAAGGKSAWFMLRRNIDRLLNMMRRPDDVPGFSIEDLDRDLKDKQCGNDVTLDHYIVKYLRDSYVQENIFAKVREYPAGNDGTVLAVLRDLRRYLVLVEAQMCAVGAVHPEQVSMVRDWWETQIKNTEVKIRVTDHQPGTPEDGGHHEERIVTKDPNLAKPYGKEPDMADLAPWAVSSAWRQEHGDMGGRFDTYWHARAPNLWVLEAAVPDRAGTPPGVIGHLYTASAREGGFRVLDVRHCPPAAREWFPRFRRELNTVERDELPEWAREMYLWINADTKWVLGPGYEAWALEA